MFQRLTGLTLTCLLGAFALAPCGANRADAADLVWEIVEDYEPLVDLDELTVEEAETDARERKAIMKSDQMLDALIWIDNYFDSLVEFDEGHKQEFDALIKRMSSVDLRWFLKKLDQQRGMLRRRQSASERMREQSLSLTRQLRRGQTFVRSRPSGRDYFHTADAYYPAQTFAASRLPHSVYPPLITSREVARYVVASAIFGWWWR